MRVGAHAHSAQLDTGRYKQGNRGITIALALWPILWIVLPWSLELVPPVDNLEQLVWSQSLELGYYKHPPLPTWILIGAERLAGPSLLLTEILAVGALVAGGYFLWCLARELLGARGGMLAVLATACMAFYSYRAHAYNHNSWLVAFSYASTWYLWRAVASGRRRDWLLWGATAAAAALSKYQFAIVLACWLGILLHLRLYRDPKVRTGALLGAACAAVLWLPHFLWLLRTHFLPLHYANALILAHLGPLRRLDVSAGFLLQQVRDVLPAALMIYLAGRFSSSPGSLRAPTRSAVAGAPSSGTPLDTGPCAERPDPQRQVWIGWLALGPLAFTLLLGLVSGSRLENEWGNGCMQFSALALIEWSLVSWGRRGCESAAPPAMLAAFALVQAGLVGYVLTTDLYQREQRLGAGELRSFDPRAFSQAVRSDWYRHTREPLRYVSGDWSAFIAVYSPEHPQVLLEGNPRYAPWVSLAAMRRCGAVYFSPVQPPSGSASRAGQFATLDYHHAFRAVPVTIHWRIVDPTPACESSPTG